MLVPAILYKDEIANKFLSYNYTEDMFNFTGCLVNYQPEIKEDSDDSFYQYAIIDNGKLIGYFAYIINWYSSCAYQFGLFSFDKNNKMIGLDIYREVKKIINNYHIHRIEWRMIGGNPVEKHYDRFCNKYNGKKFVLTDAIRDRNGEYHNDVIYEILFDEHKHK